MNKEVEIVLAKGALRRGLSKKEAEVLIHANDPESLSAIFATASKIKNEIYGERLVLFAPLYVSDFCTNDCLYCNFHSSNEEMLRRQLSMEEIKAETKCLIDMGHKRVLIEFGEDPRNTIDYVCNAVEAIYSVKSGNGNIRRVNVNIAATTVEDYERLKEAGIGTYQLFQETYHRPTYEAVHKGPKGDFDRQLRAHDRAFEAGLTDLGIGVLFGLYDWRFEVLSLIEHAAYMEKNFGVGPHTISLPRLRPAPTVLYQPKYPVSDEDFLKIIAILRIAVPYTGMILTTRESPQMRRRAFQLGISQASAASVTFPGGYRDTRCEARGAFEGQFETQDHRTVDEIIKSVVEDGLIPSFCTACYRVGRTGEKFMEIAKPGDIHKFCRPNALLTFAEYLEDYGDSGARSTGDRLIKKYLDEIDDSKIKEETKKRLIEIRHGMRDLCF